VMLRQYGRGRLKEETRYRGGGEQTSAKVDKKVRGGGS